MADETKEAAGGKKPVVPAAKARLRKRYEDQVLPALMQEFGIKNKMAVPRLTKVCLNMGFGKAGAEGNSKFVEQCVSDMTTIAGQKAVVTIATKSISNFKLRENMKVGCRVTLRGPRMYEFLDRLLNVAIPRIRDFRGVSPRSFDGRGNYSMGLQEQTVFPEIDPDKADVVHGMDVTICTTASSDDQARALLRHMGMPFRER